MSSTPSERNGDTGGKELIAALYVCMVTKLEDVFFLKDLERKLSSKASTWQQVGTCTCWLLFELGGLKAFVSFGGRKVFFLSCLIRSCKFRRPFIRDKASIHMDRQKTMESILPSYLLLG
jgi:hypothetical protein